MHRLALAIALALLAGLAASPSAAMPPAALAPVIATTFAVSLTTATIIAQVAVTVLSLAASILLAPKPKAPRQPELIRDLAQTKERPPKRFVYGEHRVPASPAPERVRGRILVGCYILNSRPSDGGFTLRLDERDVELTGDPYDFSGPGAVATNAPFDNDIVTVWFGLGDQTGPPAAIVAEFPYAEPDDTDLFKATDGWTGLTVAWIRFNAGGNSSRAQRWPRVPPQVKVTGRFSKVWDPRDPAQDPDDPATWTFSDNQALCLLDALRQNPIQAYQLDGLMLETFEDAADIADEAVPLKAGGTEPRYRVSGVLAFSDAELEDQLIPLAQAGAGDLIRVGGKLGLAAGAWRPPVHTLTDLLRDGLEFADLKRGRELPTQIRTTYIAANRGYEDAELAPYDIPGALAADGGIDRVTDLALPYVTSPTQAMRIRKIMGRKLRRQKKLTAIAPPTAIDLVPGATATVALAAPFNRFDGVYEVETINPAADLVGAEGGVALRCPIVLVETAADIFDWFEDEEEAIVGGEVDGSVAALAPPGAITVSTGSGVDLDTGAGVVVRAKYAFDPSTSETVDHYESEFRVNDGPWQALDAIDADVRDGAGDVFGYLQPIKLGASYDIRVRAVASAVEKSDFVTVEDVVVSMALSGVSVSDGGSLSVDVDLTTPDTIAFAAVEVWRATTTSFGDAERQGDPVPLDAGETTSVSVTTLEGTANFWAVPISTTGDMGPVDGPHSATITNI